MSEFHGGDAYDIQSAYMRALCLLSQGKSCEAVSELRRIEEFVERNPNVVSLKLKREILDLRRLAESRALPSVPGPAPNKSHCVELELRTFERGPSVALRLDALGTTALVVVLAIGAALVITEKIDLALLTSFYRNFGFS